MESESPLRAKQILNYWNQIKLEELSKDGLSF